MEVAYLAVARFRKPHGLKGEILVVALTDRPAELFAPGRLLMPLDPEGRPEPPALTVERGRWYHGRQWLLKLEGSTRTMVEGWSGRHFGVPQSELPQPADDEMYEHEIPGATVVAGGVTIGIADGLAGVPGAPLLVVKAGEREHLIPFRPPILVRLDRRARVIEVDPPAGLLEL